MDLDQLKQTFIDTCNTAIHRAGLKELLDWLEKEDFFTAPSSSKYHGAYKGGLCQHSLDVYDFARKLAPLSPVPLSEESLAVAALFHDLCKVNFYKFDVRNQKVDGNWVQVPTVQVDEKFSYGGHGSKSVFLVQWFMRLSPEEAVAINCHMGFSEGITNQSSISHAYKACPLAWVIHAADEAATYLLDR